MSPGVRNFIKYSIFILIINLIVLFSLEGLLRIFISSPNKYFTETRDEQDRVWVEYRFSPLKPKFLKEKDRNTFRIFAFGGSTTLGFPYYPRSSFSKMLETALKKSAPDKKIEVVNLGLTGMNSLEIKHCLYESLRYSPDLVIIYSGHNEFFTASLIPDWRSPRLDHFLESFRLHSRLYQVLSRTDLLLAMIPAAIGTNQELVEKVNIDFELVPIENRPMSREYSQDRLQGYRYHLDQILTRLNREKVPAIICTVAVNLQDWPPEWLPSPENLSDSQWNDLKQNLHQADFDIADGKLEEAELILNRFQPRTSQYAMYYFIRAWLEEKRNHYELARHYFLLARKYDNSRHRAPPEINQIIRELAPEKNALVVDVEKLFFENSATTPGFDLFVDHVHPNLSGQRLIARKLFQTLAEKQLLPLSQPLPDFPSLDDFKNEFELNQENLPEIDRLLSYYLLQRHFPERDRQTIKLLNEVISKHPDHFYARICLMAILLEQSREEEAIQVIKDTFQAAGGIQPVQKMLLRYFFPKILIQGNYLLVHLNLDPTVPPLRGILLVRSKPEQTRTRAILPLDQYHWIFQYFPETNEIRNVTNSGLSIYQAHQAFCQSGKLKTLDFNNYFAQDPKSLHTYQADLSAQGDELRMDLLGNDPWLSFPIKLETSRVSSLNLEIAVKPEDENQKQSELNLYWSGSPTPIFSEAQKISFPLTTKGRFQAVEIELSENINWLSSKEILFLRLDPATFPGKARIREFKMVFCLPDSSQPTPE